MKRNLRDLKSHKTANITVIKILLSSILTVLIRKTEFALQCKIQTHISYNFFLMTELFQTLSTFIPIANSYHLKLT